MKKVLSFVAILSVLAIYSCGGSTEGTEVASDSTVVKADSACCVDTTAPKAATDTTTAKEEAEKK